MATQKISLPAKTWTALPVATKFLAQNAGNYVVFIQAGTNAPTEADGHRLQPKLSMSNLSTEQHWAYCEYPINLFFTENDL